MATTKKKTAQAAETAVQEAAAVAVAAPAAETAKAAKAAKPAAKRTCKRKTAEAPAAPAAAEKPAAKRGPRKSAKTVEKVVVQIMGKDATPEDMVARAKADWEAQGHSISEIKSLAVYLNTAEGRVYYVVNDDLNSGSFEF